MEAFLLFLMFMFARKGGSPLFPAASSAPMPLPSTGPSAFPPVPATHAPAPVTSPSVHAGAKWVPYHPLNQAVIARAEQLLHDATMRPNDERIEPDPASGGTVRYLKLASPPGHISVTAWKPTVAQPAATPTSTASPGLVPASHASASRVLRRGMKGADVANWQARLGLPSDGTFGRQTEAATMAFQRAHGLKPDGVVGPQTINAANLVAA